LYFRLDIVRGQIDDHVGKHGNSDAPRAREVLDTRQKIIGELEQLDRDFFG